MRQTFAPLALAALAAAKPVPQGVTSAISPSSSPPAGCSTSYSGQFQIEVIPIGSSKVKRQSGELLITLQDGKLMDNDGRTGYIAANYQLQFDDPPQTGAIYTSGFSVCSNGDLALGSQTTWYRCLSGDFYNLYSKSTGAQCSAANIVVLGASGGSVATTAGAATQITDGQVQATTGAVTQITDGQVQAPTNVVTQITDGQIQAPTGAVTQISDGQIQAPTGAVTQISDGQIQAPTGAVTQISDGQIQAPTGAPVTQISDGQIQAPTGAPVTQISDGQIQAPTGMPVTQISDGQIQAPTGMPVTQISDGQIQAPTMAPTGMYPSGNASVAMPSASVVPATGGASTISNSIFGLVAGVLAVMVL